MFLLLVVHPPLVCDRAALDQISIAICHPASSHPVHTVEVPCELAERIADEVLEVQVANAGFISRVPDPECTCIPTTREGLDEPMFLVAPDMTAIYSFEVPPVVVRPVLESLAAPSRRRMGTRISYEAAGPTLVLMGRHFVELAPVIDARLPLLHCRGVAGGSLIRKSCVYQLKQDKKGCQQADHT